MKRALPVLALALLPACFVVPVLQRSEDELFAKTRSELEVLLVPGATTRADALFALGDPDRRLHDDRTLVYVRSQADALILFPAPTELGLGGFETEDLHFLVLRFDAAGRLVDWRLDEVENEEDLAELLPSAGES